MIKKSVAVVAMTGGLVAGLAGTAHAEAEAEGAAVGSPGVVSGNAVQVPIHIPVNVCGNTVDIIGVLNPTLGNTCANVDKDVEAGR
ncbi:chaplin [Allostreptomyces psammosilenae]|uniref:Chaplin domain-containing protein n=1 Tax=Allostreptomyces psammosilenae TaxID=1892865 RepID=A0A852ZZX4_9ACTN|nr:chaplin [Allostreptomyces psammosilenae]NYI06770.1 hypothetical protein [Allostreptomyces psammosilenae]